MTTISLINDIKSVQTVPAVPTAPVVTTNPVIIKVDKITFDNLEIDRICLGNPEVKTIKGQSVSYYTVPIQYNAGTKDKPKYVDLAIEFPELDSTGIIINKDEKTGNVSRSIAIPLDPEKDPTKTVYEKNNAIYARISEILEVRKEIDIRVPNFQKSNPMGTGFRPINNYPKDKKTGKTLSGKNPSFYAKVFKWGSDTGFTQFKTIFTKASDGKQIDDWHLLEAVQMKNIPKVHYKELYINGTGLISVQCKLLSTVIRTIKDRSSETTQKDTIARIQAEDPSVASALNEQLAKLAETRADKIREMQELEKKVEAMKVQLNPQSQSQPQQSTYPNYPQLPTMGSMMPLNDQNFGQSRPNPSMTMMNPNNSQMMNPAMSYQMPTGMQYGPRQQL